MFVALSFVGTLPSYTVECIHQIQTFFDGEVYIIASDFDSPFLKGPWKKRVHVIDYDRVRSMVFDELVAKHRSRFAIISGLTGREELFIRSFERLFLLQQLMIQRELTDGLFLELDVLIYQDPRLWLPEFQKYSLCYMFDNYNRCSSALMYVKNANALDGLLSYCSHYIQHANEFINEMSCLYQYYESQQSPSSIQLLPTHWSEPAIASEHFGKFGNTIFDALGIGIMMLGVDPFHTQGMIKRNTRWNMCLIDYTVYPYRWNTDDMNRRIPEMWTGKEWIRINNLHVHSKLLEDGLSVPRIS